MSRPAFLLFFFSVVFVNLAASAQTIRFAPSAQSVTSRFPSAVVVDINGDGWLETLGTLNDGAGNLLPLSTTTMGLDGLFVTYRPNDARVADFNEDGCPDLIAQGYTSTKTDTRALLYFNDCSGRFRQDTTFAGLNLRGRGEGLAVADFNNDGHLDIFLPYYTFQPCTDSLCPNSSQSYLFLGDGHGHFREVAAAAGVDLAASPGATPEGTQVADVDNNGLLDLYVGGHLFMNESVDATGIPHFRDCGCGLPPAPTPRNPGWDDRADEGFKFLDWNNDGLLDLVIQNWGNGPPPPNGPPSPPGPTLYLNTGTAGHPFFAAQAQATDGSGHPFFSTGAPEYQQLPFSSSYGINAYDMDNDGLEDIIVAASGGGYPPHYSNTVFRNTGYGYEQVHTPDVPALSYGTMAFGDINHDGKIDLIYSWPLAQNPYYWVNTSPTSASFLSIEVLGPNGERNQQGRVVQVQPQAASNVTYTRVVDGGSGYHSQSQYALLVGTPYPGPHKVTAFYPAAEGSTTSVSITMNPGEYAKITEPPSLGLGVAFGGSSAATVAAGQTANYLLTIGGRGIGGTASLTCTGMPSGAECSAPDTLGIQATPASTFTVSVTTKVHSAARVTLDGSGLGWVLGAGLLGILLLLLLSQKTRLGGGAAATLLVLLLFLSSCGEGNSGAAPSNPNGMGGTYVLTITASIGAISQSMPITLIVQ